MLEGREAERSRLPYHSALIFHLCSLLPYGSSWPVAGYWWSALLSEFFFFFFFFFTKTKWPLFSCQHIPRTTIWGKLNNENMCCWLKDELGINFIACILNIKWSVDFCAAAWWIYTQILKHNSCSFYIFVSFVSALDVWGVWGVWGCSLNLILSFQSCLLNALAVFFVCLLILSSHLSLIFLAHGLDNLVIILRRCSRHGEILSVSFLFFLFLFVDAQK